MKFWSWLVVFVIYHSVLTNSTAQNVRLYKSVVFKVDTVDFYSEKHTAKHQEKNYHFVKMSQHSDVVKVEIALQDSVFNGRFQLKENESLELLDSVRSVPENNAIEFKIRLKDNKMFFRGDLVLFSDLDTKRLLNVPVFLFPDTKLLPMSDLHELFQEEELIVDIVCQNCWNIQANPDWQSNDEFDYKISKQLNSIRLQVRPHILGKRSLSIPIRTIQPVVQKDGTIGNLLYNLELRFNVKPNLIDFLSFDKEDVIFDQANFQNGEEIQVRNNPNLILKKTYRIENSQEPGGKLIAELYVRSVLANGKVLCWLRPFSLHRLREGFLYIKDGDKTRFVANLNILEKPRIDAIQIMRKNEDWSDKLYARPGEEVELKIVGNGLQKAKIQLDGLAGLKKDSIGVSDEVAFFKLTVPRNYSKKKSAFFMNNQVTAFDLQLKEFQEPRQLDFLRLNYGDESIALFDEKFDKPILYDKLLKDVVLVLTNDKIDNGLSFYGKQYLELEVKLVSPKGEMKETFRKEIVVCPSEASERFANYDRTDCDNASISLNDLLNTKTYNLEGYSQLFISVKHNRKHYTTSGYSRSVNIILKRNVVFDLQVSFPAGMLLKRFDTDGIGALTGISIAAIAQLSFYDNLQIGKVKPYRVGAGFLAINAFNFSESANRDVAAVAMVSVYPLNRNSKFSFPLHTGFGYMLKSGSWFLLFGPGIEVRF